MRFFRFCLFVLNALIVWPSLVSCGRNNSLELEEPKSEIDVSIDDSYSLLGHKVYELCEPSPGSRPESVYLARIENSLIIDGDQLSISGYQMSHKPIVVSLVYRAQCTPEKCKDLMVQLYSTMDQEIVANLRDVSSTASRDILAFVEGHISVVIAQSRINGQEMTKVEVEIKDTRFTDW